MMTKLRGVAGRVLKIFTDIAYERSKKRLKSNVQINSSKYGEYLNVQLKRSIAKRSSPLQKRTQIFVDQIDQMVKFAGKDVLCIGSRNAEELQYIVSKQANSAIGIDLHSNNDLVMVMDMHNMTFEDNRFDLIYSSHSLEHSFDPRSVVTEISRVAREGAVVAIEVPVKFEVRGADIVDLADLAGLYRLFDGIPMETIWSETCKPQTEANPASNSIIRAILMINLPVE